MTGRANPDGTEGYAEAANDLFGRYESVSFADVHRPVLHLLPPAPCRVLDIGSGTGRDAAALAAMGHRVVAVEPTEPFRTRAASHHPSPLIEWLDDSLPALEGLSSRGAQFEIILLTAVWMHLDRHQRRRGMSNVAALAAGGGVMIMSLRHGPIPAGRRMFDVSTDETVSLAEGCGLRLVLNATAPSALASASVSWTWLAFAKSGRAIL